MTQASQAPSGDQLTVTTRRSAVRSGVQCAGSGPWIQTAGSPPRSETKAMWCPCGEGAADQLA